MDVEVSPGVLRGAIRVPGSKSIAQRALLLATRRGGLVRNVPTGDDLERLAVALRQLGFTLEFDGSDVTVGGDFHHEEVELDLGDNGTGARCLTAFAALRPVATVIDGSANLRRRPVAPLCEALRELGAEVDGDTFPVRVRGPIRPGRVRVSTDQSSQFATALILLVDRVRGLRVSVVGKRSFSYITLTAHVQRTFETPYTVEPDFSSAAGLAFGAAASGGDLLLEGLQLSTPQPDARVVPILNRFGARVTGEDGGVRVRGNALRGITTDLSNCPDLAPLVGALGALADGETVATGAPHLVHKESDRIRTTVAMVRALGGEAEPVEGGFRIRGGVPLRGATVDAAGDHRIAMAAGVLALRVPGVTVAGAEAVTKSYPGYFRDLASLTVSPPTEPIPSEST